MDSRRQVFEHAKRNRDFALTVAAAMVERLVSGFDAGFGQALRKTDPCTALRAVAEAFREREDRNDRAARAEDATSCGMLSDLCAHHGLRWEEIDRRSANPRKVS